MAKNISTCIIPAAGKGSRWAPVSGYLPKEMLPLVDRPVLEWVIEEAVRSKCSEMIIIINKQKEVIKDYLKKISLSKKINIHFVYQIKPRGIAHAISFCQEFTKNNPFVVALPDLPTISKKPVIQQLTDKFSSLKQPAHIISFCSFPSEALYHYSECMLETRKDKLLNIAHFCPKDPNNMPHHPGSRIRMSGRYIFTPEIYPAISQLLDEFQEDEVRDTDALKKAIQLGQKVLGLEISGRTYNTGTPTSYIRANTAFFKKRKFNG